MTNHHLPDAAFCCIGPSLVIQQLLPPGKYLLFVNGNDTWRCVILERGEEKGTVSAPELVIMSTAESNRE